MLVRFIECLLSKTCLVTFICQIVDAECQLCKAWYGKWNGKCNGKWNGMENGMEWNMKWNGK